MVGDGHGPSKATVFRAVHKVTAAICANFSSVITWPDDMDAVKEAFAEKAGMPDVLGESFMLSEIRNAAYPKTTKCNDVTVTSY